MEREIRRTAHVCVRFNVCGRPSAGRWWEAVEWEGAGREGRAQDGRLVEEGLTEVTEGHLTWRGVDGMKPAFGAAGLALFYLT